MPTEENRQSDCEDNAVMERFFSTAQTELRDQFDSCRGAKRTLVDDIDVFSDQRRRHSSIDAVSPAIFERESDQRAWTLSFTEECKAGAVRLVLDDGTTVGAAARDLDVTESSFRNWVERARADRGKGQPGVLTTAERWS